MNQSFNITETESKHNNSVSARNSAASAATIISAALHLKEVQIS